MINHRGQKKKIIQKKMTSKNNQNETSGSFVGHLTELRSRLIKSFIFLIFIFLICYFFSAEIYRFLVQPYSDVVLSNKLTSTTPSEVRISTIVLCTLNDNIDKRAEAKTMGILLKNIGNNFFFCDGLKG